MVNVLIVSHYSAPHIGGIEQVAINQAVVLAQHDFATTIVSATAPGKISGLSRWREIPITRLPTNNFVVRKFDIPFPLLGIGSMVTLWRTVRNNQIIHVHDVFYQISWCAAIFAILQRKPLFLTQHVAMVNHASRAVTLVQKIVYGTFGALIFNWSKLIVVYNKHVEQFLLLRGVKSSKVHLLANGIDTNEFFPVNHMGEKSALRKELGLPQETPLVLFAGRFVDKKGYDIAYAARSAKYQLVFVGTGEFPDAWKNTPGVIFLGAKLPAELARIYRACDAFIFPTIGEVMTLTMQEAMASGLLVVTTENAAYDQYLLDTDAVSLVPRTAVAFRERLEQLLQVPARMVQSSQFVRAFAVKHFDVQYNSTQLLSLYAPFITRV